MILRRLYILLSISLFAGMPAFALYDNLVRLDDLSFNSPFEKEAFSNLQNNEAAYLKLFLAVSPSSDDELFENVKRSVSQEVQRINDKKFSKSSDEKKVKSIYKWVNNDILYTYKEQILFRDIFSTGNFNCVTASAYYGFLFMELGIGFEFKETANHVHPVAFPTTTQIKVETTDPVFGFQYFDPKLKTQFANYLLSSKIISKEELNSSSVDAVFNKYYFPESSIGMRELAGLQYLNDALFNYGRDDYRYALGQIQKAYYLYPSDRISMVMLFILSRCLAETDYKDIEDASLLVYTSRFVGKYLDLASFNSEFYGLTDKVLLQRSQFELYDQFYAYLVNRIDSGGIRNSVEFAYNYQKGDLLMTTFHVNEALSCFEKALSIEPDNLDVQTSAVKSLAFSFGTSSNQEIVSRLENFEDHFPVMKKNESFISLQMLAYLKLGEEKFDFENPSEGEELLKNFENLFDQHPGISIQYENVGDAYSAAAVYYFKLGDKNSARNYLNRGLRISPENYQIMYRLRAIE